MRIQFEMSGGLAFFPALAAPKTIDTTTLPEATARRLEELVADAEFFTRPQQQSSAGGADTQLYVLTVEDQGADRTLEFREPITEPAINNLISFLRSLA